MMRREVHADLKTTLDQIGWHVLRSGEKVGEGVIRQVAQTLGLIVVERGKPEIQSLSPRDEQNAASASLSRKFGRGMLPFHCDTAHWLIPSRYLVMGCVDPGCVSAPTMLLDAHDPGFSDEEKMLLRSACFVVRNGSRSFYGSIADRYRRFVRVDPGCMEPVDEDAARALELYGRERQLHRAITHDWRTGDILVIDNWRILHGRGNNEPADPKRVLMRAYVQ